MVMALSLALGTEGQTKLRQRKFFPSSLQGQMTLDAHAPHRVSMLRDNQVALAKLRCLSLEIHPMEMLADGQDCQIPTAEVWCRLSPSTCTTELRAGADLISVCSYFRYLCRALCFLGQCSMLSCATLVH